MLLKFSKNLTNFRQNSLFVNYKNSKNSLSIFPFDKLPRNGHTVTHKEKQNEYYPIGKIFFSLALGLYLYKERKKYLQSNVGIWPIAECATVVKSGGLRNKFNFVADVVEGAVEAVVYIEIVDTTGRLLTRGGGPAALSNGSGFIIQSDGLVLTNAHVVTQHGGGGVVVKLSDGRSFHAQIEKVDMQADLATLRINAQDLPVLKLGSSADLRAGEWVVAIGSPLTLSNTVTAGVVSASQRPAKQLGIQHSEINYIQTDASITFGNSGGPLVNLDGEVIGINSIKISPGISFAIPIDYAKEFLNKQPRARTDSKGHKSYIGVTMVSLNPDVVNALHGRGMLPLNITGGILVWKVAEGGPAYRYGLRPGDVITHINDVVATRVQDMYDALENDKVLRVVAVRNGHPIQLSIVPIT